MSSFVLRGGPLVDGTGFIDVHTHYDAQITWDRDLTPSCWFDIAIKSCQRMSPDGGKLRCVG